MTIDEALLQLRQLADDGNDYEADHVNADAILLELIGDAGITEAFKAIGKWYA